MHTQFDPTTRPPRFRRLAVVATLAAALAFSLVPAAQAGPAERPTLSSLLSAPRAKPVSPLPPGRAEQGKTPKQALACNYAVYAKFVERWNKWGFRFGCPTGNSFFYGNGVYQWFQYGSMVWSPSQGDNMVASAFKLNGRDVYFQWGWSNPFHYNDWLFNSKYEGSEEFADECHADKRHCNPLYNNGGEIGWGNLRAGKHSIQVEGCDLGSSHTCRQGWTLPLDIWLP